MSNIAIHFAPGFLCWHRRWSGSGRCHWR